MAACSREPQASVNRIAILPFENLSGDASLDWVSNAAPSILAEQLIGSPSTVPMRALSVSDGYLAAATRFVHGTFTQRNGALDFEIETEDAARHKMLSQEDLNGPVLEVMNRAARFIDAAHSQPFSTSNAEAVAAWAHGDYEHAVALDPDFGAAWLSWAETLSARGQVSEAIAVTARALDRSTLRSPIARARIAVISADLRKDVLARAQALATLHSLDPADTALTLRLADAETQARNFSAAAALYQTILKQEPGNTSALLALGYAQAFSGDVDTARRTFEDYGKREGQKTNSLDSLGEALFMNGRFKDAEKSFLAAHDSNPAFLGGSDLEKAAYSHWLAGDVKGADAIMARYLEFRAQSHDPLIPWRHACWYYATGRRDLATKTLSATPPALSERQIAAWNAAPPNDLDALKQAYLQTAPSSDGIVRTRYAAALFRAGQKQQAAELIKRWPLPVENNVDQLQESTVFPLLLDLRKQIP